MKIKLFEHIKGSFYNTETCGVFIGENLMKPCNPIIVNGHSFKLIQQYNTIFLCWRCSCGWHMLTEREELGPLSSKFIIEFKRRLGHGFLTTKFVPECTLENKMEMILA